MVGVCAGSRALDRARIAHGQERFRTPARILVLIVMGLPPSRVPSCTTQRRGGMPCAAESRLRTADRRAVEPSFDRCPRDEAMTYHRSRSAIGWQSGNQWIWNRARNQPQLRPPPGRPGCLVVAVPPRTLDLIFIVVLLRCEAVNVRVSDRTQCAECAECRSAAAAAAAAALDGAGADLGLDLHLKTPDECKWECVRAARGAVGLSCRRAAGP